MKFVIGLIALGLMVAGGFFAVDGAVTPTKNVLQQIAARLELFQGISIFALGLIAFAIACLIDCIQSTDAKK